MAQDYLEVVSQAFAVARGGAVKPIYNVWHFRRLANVAPPVKSQIDTAFQAAIMVPVLALLNVDYTQTANTVRFFDDALDAPNSFPQSGVGGGTGMRMETFVTAVLNYKSATKGKFARGSKHLAPIGENQSNGDVLEAATVTLLTAVGTAYLAGFTDASGNVWKPVVKSGKPPAQYKTNQVTVVTYDVISFSVNKTTGIMKRRKVRTVV